MMSLVPRGSGQSHDGGGAHDVRPDADAGAIDEPGGHGALAHLDGVEAVRFGIECEQRVERGLEW